jgi:hypothetical protein
MVTSEMSAGMKLPGIDDRPKNDASRQLLLATRVPVMVKNRERQCGGVYVWESETKE